MLSMEPERQSGRRTEHRQRIFGKKTIHIFLSSSLFVCSFFYFFISLFDIGLFVVDYTTFTTFPPCMIEYGNFPLERVKHNMQFFQFPKKRAHYIRRILSVLHQNEGGIGKSIPDAQEISRDPREISTAEGMDFSIPPEYRHTPHHQSIYRDRSGNPSLWTRKD